MVGRRGASSPSAEARHSPLTVGLEAYFDVPWESSVTLQSIWRLATDSVGDGPSGP